MDPNQIQGSAQPPQAHGGLSLVTERIPRSRKKGFVRRSKVHLVVCCLAMTSFLGSLRVHGADFSQVEKIGRSKGLTTEIVTALYQDRSGLVWIGSRDGLRVYDGNSFRLFDHDHSNADSISDNGIRTIYEDDRSRLWIGTNTGGLELLDRSTGKFTHFRHSSADVHSLSNDSVY